MGWLSDLFSGNDKTAINMMKQRWGVTDEYIKQMQALARGDALNLSPGMQESRRLGTQAALDVFGQTMPQQMSAFQQGNMAAQNAILGLPVAPQGQPFQIGYDPSYMQQQLPQMPSPADLLGGVPNAPGGMADQPNSSSPRVRGNLPDYGNPATGGATGYGGGATYDSYWNGNFGPSGGGQGINDALNSMFPQLSGSDPGMVEKFLAEHGDNVGKLIGYGSGVPLGGTIGKFLGGLGMDAYWKNHQWQNPIPPDAPQPFNVDEAINNWQNYGGPEPQNSPYLGPSVYQPIGPGSDWYIDTTYGGPPTKNPPINGAPGRNLGMFFGGDIRNKLRAGALPPPTPYNES